MAANAPIINERGLVTARRGTWHLLPGSRRRSPVFEEVLLPQLDALYGVALRLTGDPDDAEDLLHDAVLRAFVKFDQLRHPGAARTWFVRIMTTVHLNQRRARRLWDALSEQESEPAVEETPESDLLRRCERQEVDAALRELPHDFRMTVLLADVEEIPLRDIAALCGCPIGTVASRLSRGRALLRTRLLAGRAAWGEEA